MTDHDTTAGLAAAIAAAQPRGMRLVAGVEITAIENGHDVHLLAYFIDTANASFAEFLAAQRGHRLRRVRSIAERLAALGHPIDVDPLLAAAAGKQRSIGRPQIADALVAAGYAVSRDDAFTRLLGDGAPAFVPRTGPDPETVVSIVRGAGGVVSMAHPGLTKMDGIMPRLARAGLAALEVRHSEHDAETEERYRQLARELGLAVSGGSDFHGDVGRRAAQIGRVTISEEELAALESRRP